jgi:hypothetical protein
MAKRVYTKEEADAILARALELQGRGDGTSHDDLLAAGREVGLPPEAIERAAEDVLAKQGEAVALREIRGRAWRGFYAHLVPYALVNLLLVTINWMTGGPPWALAPILGWGIGLVLHLLSVANPDPRRMRRRLEAEQRRTAFRAALQASAQVRIATLQEQERARVGAAPDEGEDDAETAPPAAGRAR